MGAHQYMVCGFDALCSGSYFNPKINAGFFGIIGGISPYRCIFASSLIKSLNKKSMSALSDKLGALIVAQIDFQDDQLEALVNASAKATEATIAFAAAIGDDEAANNAAASLVDLASEIGTAFPGLTAEQADKFKAIVSNVYEGESEEVDSLGEAIFNHAVDAVLAAKELNAYVESVREQA